MGITGSQTALMDARAGVARSGATRSDYYRPFVALTIGGTDYTRRALRSSIEIEDVANEQPNTMTLLVRSSPGYIPTRGQEIIVGIGAISNRLFAGRILDAALRPGNKRFQNWRWELSCIDYTWDMDEDKFSKVYTNQSASDIAIDIVTNFTSGFTTTNVAAGLPTIDEISFTDVYPSEALTRLVNRFGGLWYPDYYKDIHLFLDETDQAPAELTDTSRQFWDLELRTDLSQVRTRVYGWGGGGTCTAATAAGAASIPVSECGWYSSSGGQVRTGTQIITYTGRSATSGAGNLTGVPASGTGAIQTAIKIDDDIDLWVQRDDSAAQTALAAITGRSGVRATSFQDRRLGLTELTERADAELAQYSAAMVNLGYTTRDKFARSGKQLSVDVASVLTGTLRIQRVRISGFRSIYRFPERRVEAANVRTTADLMDMLKASAAAAMKTE